MAFESFYGGRQGASIVIVKRFDAIDTTKTVSTYKGCYLAITPDIIDNEGRHTYLYIDGDYIRRDASNYTKYAWDFVVLDGKSMPTKASVEDTTVTYRNLPSEPAEGMVQLFSLGGDSTDVVNYGEYVIIDTPNKSDPDNGKIYRRGLSWNDESDPLKGAEYIGQVVGPKGEAPDIAINTENYIKSIPGYHSGEYSKVNESIIPGKGVDGSTDRIEQYVGSYDPDAVSAIDYLVSKVSTPSATIVYCLTNIKTSDYEYYTKEDGGDWTLRTISYNDKITFSWVTVRDPYGNVEGALIGFTTPYLINDFIAEGVSPYYNKNADGSVNKTNLITRIDDRTHPFYHFWKLSIPQGVKGDSLKDLERVNTEGRKGATYYLDTACENEVGILEDYVPIDYENIDFKTATYIPIVINGTTYYLKNDEESTTTSILRYTEINYDKKEEGDEKYVDVSPYNTIRQTKVTPDGKMSIEYTYDNWKNIGQIKLERNTLAILCRLPEERLLYDDSGSDVSIPPEYMLHAIELRSMGGSYIYIEDEGKDDRYIGWLVAIGEEDEEDDDVYAYDYIDKSWYRIGSLNGAAISANRIIAKAPASNPPERMLENGFWFVTEDGIQAN